MFFGIIAFEEYLYGSKTGESKTKKKKKKRMKKDEKCHKINLVSCEYVKN